MAGSENEPSEQPVREQLKKTSIDTANASEHSTQDQDDDVDALAPSTSTIPRKRSSVDLDKENPLNRDLDDTSNNKHSRKRSRENKLEYEGERNGAEVETSQASQAKTQAESTRPATPEQQIPEKRTEDEVEDVTSPKTKRSRTQNKASDGNATSNVEAKSSFGNASVLSPFGSVTSPKTASEQPQTSSSAFAASGFSALSNSSSSGFGAVGKSAGLSSFASPKKTNEAPANDAPKVSSFGSASGAKSPFAASGNKLSSFGSGFAKSNGSAFASASGFGSLGGGKSLTSFASGKTGGVLGSQKPVKPFGAPADDDEEAPDDDDDGDESGFKSPRDDPTEDKKDARFFEQEVETGEEDEEVVYQCRAKLYNYVDNGAGKKEWKERGLGVLKLNAKRPDDLLLRPDQSAPADGEKNANLARFLMRADGSHRIVLNTPIKKEMKFGSAQGGPPDNGLMLFMGTIDGKSTLETMQLKMKPQFALELYNKIIDMQSEA